VNWEPVKTAVYEEKIDHQFWQKNPQTFSVLGVKKKLVGGILVIQSSNCKATI